MVDFTEDEHDSLLHLGIRRKSGRYPWGSGEDPYQRAAGVKSFMDEIKKEQPGITEAGIAKALSDYAGEPVSTTELRAAVAVSTEMIRGENQATATRLRDKGMSNGAIALQMGLGSGKSAESTVRGWLKNSDTIKENSLRATANKLKEQLETKPFLDVGKGNHLYMGITSTKLNTALAMLQDEGYAVHPIKVPQLGGADKLTSVKVLTKGDVSWSEARQAVLRGDLSIITAQSDDGGLSYKVPKDKPVSVAAKRIEVRYGKDGGSAMDGVIELRRNVDDLSLGKNRYAQVRVAVDGTHYLKGMAMYSDDMPAGVDVRFNTNKSDTGNKLDAMKPLKTSKEGDALDANNAFGAQVRPHVYIDKKTGKEKTSPLNIVNEEGDWDKWSKTLSSQMLSKQPNPFARRQLDQAHSHREEELNTIMSLTNRVVKKKLLDEFSESADSDAVHLAAAAMPRQSTHVILPINSIRPNEIYAPNYNNGERVALVRYPHSGPFEIPELTVNNKNLDARRILQDARDAVAIHHSVAQKLSGADFDGDAVAVIPNDEGHVKHRPSLAKLKDFDPKELYKIPDDDTKTKRMTKENTQNEMGKISNLITDMSIHGANDDEMSRAVRHSMVVIDAEKHGLNYKQSAIDNNINDLKSRYQARYGSSSRPGGASTLISRASADARIPQQKLRSKKTGGPPIDPKTGEKVFIPTGRTYTKVTTTVDKKTGRTITKSEVLPKLTKGTQMEFAKDARQLLSGDPTKPFDGPDRGTGMERTYANHANAMKALGNKARKESVSLVMPKLSGAAKAVYSKEIASLNGKLEIALRNAPLERRAQVLGNAIAKQRIDDNPGITKDDVKKIKYQSQRDAREITGAGKIKIEIDDMEWEAIQSGAVAYSRLNEILNHADMKIVRQHATPSSRRSLTPGQLSRIKQMQASGKPMSEISSQLGIPRSTIVDNLNKA